MLSKYGNEKVKFLKPMLAIAEGAGNLSRRLDDEYEPPIDGEILLPKYHSTNHNYFIELKDGHDRIIENKYHCPAML